MDGRVMSIRWSADGEYIGWSLRTGEDVGELQVAKVDQLTSELVFRFAELPGLFKPFEFLPKLHQLAVVNGEGRVERWDYVTSERLGTFDGPPSQHVSVSPSGSLLANQERESGKIALYDSAAGKYLGSLTSPADHVFGFDWSSDGRDLFLALGTGQIQIWNLGILQKRLARIGLDWE